MKKILTIVCCLFVLSFANAQDVKPVGSLKDEVGLTKEVNEKIKAIKEKYKPQIDGIKEKIADLEKNAILDEKAKKEKKKELNAQKKELSELQDKEIRALMTPDQLIKYDEYLKKKAEEKEAKKKAEEAASLKPAN